MNQFVVRWEAETGRDIGVAKAQLRNGLLVLKHEDDKGVSFVDPVEGREVREYRLKSGLIGSLSIAGDWIIFQSSGVVHLVRGSTGEGGPSENLKEADFFRFASDTHAVFSLNRGGALMDLTSGSVVRCQDPSEDLIPVTGWSDFFLASDRASKYYVGQMEPGTGRLLRKNATLVEGFQTKGRVRLAVSPVAFAFASREGDAEIFIYNWSGEPLISTVIPDYEITESLSQNARFLLSPEGKLDRFLVTYFAEGRTRIFLLDLKNQGSIHWTTEVVGIMLEGLPIASNHLFWNTRGMDGGENVGMSLDLANGRAEPFIDEPVAPWILADGRGIFFGRETKGRKHIAYGELV